MYKALATATDAMVFLSKILKHKVTWSKDSVLVDAVVLDPGPSKFAREKGLKKTSLSNPSKSVRLTEDINCQKMLEVQTFHEAVSHSLTSVTCFVD